MTCTGSSIVERKKALSRSCSATDFKADFANAGLWCLWANSLQGCTLPQVECWMTYAGCALCPAPSSTACTLAPLLKQLIHCALLPLLWPMHR